MLGPAVTVAARGALSRETPAPAATTIKLLLVGDHQLLLRGLESFVQSDAPDMTIVGKASNGEQALSMVQRLSPDVILLDLEQEALDGLAMITRLAADRGPRILVYTSVRDLAAHREAVLHGAMGVIEKSSDPSIILKAIRHVMDGEVWLDRKSLGQVMVILLRGMRDAGAEDPRLGRLTVRERQIIAAMLANPSRPAKTVAAALGISEHTLRNHLTAIYRKLSISCRRELGTIAQTIGLSTSSARR